MLYVNPLATPHTAHLDFVQDSAAREQLALQELEHYFVYTLLQEMRKTLDTEPLLEGGREHKLFTEMLDDGLSRVIAQSGQLGLAQIMENQLHESTLRTQLDVT